MSREESPTRERILEAAGRLLEQGGGRRVRMADIAREARISRQAVYLHFENRAELLLATLRHIDALNDVQGRLAASRAADTGRERLAAWVTAWGGYIPVVYGIAKALMAMKDTDSEARLAWEDRMAGVREGCAAAVAALAAEEVLLPELSETEAIDLLWSLLSVRVWEHLRIDCGWTQERYVAHITRAAARILIRSDV